MNHYSKFFTSLLLGAIAIVGCQREPQVDPNPNFNPETDEVNAAFVMSFATGSSASTKMSANNVQQNSNFLGIDNSKIILYATGKNDAFVKKDDFAKFKQLYDLGEILTPGALTAADNASSSSNRVVQLAIPLGADAALFYGKAINGAPGKAQGQMEFNVKKDPAETGFSVVRRIGDETKVAQYDATAALMIYAINTILQSSVVATTSYDNHNKHYPKAPATQLDGLGWPELGHQYELKIGGNPLNRSTDNEWTRDLVPLEVILGQAYSTFTYIKTNEYRAGSSTAIKNMMQDLFKVVNSVNTADPTSNEEANAIRLAEKIIANMSSFFNRDNNWVYWDVETIKNGYSGNDWDARFAGAQDLNKYPYGDFGIPEGAAQLAFHPKGSGDPAESIDRFEYLHPNKALVTPGKTFEPRKYVYPAELAYYVNSPLYVTSKSDLSIADFPNGTTYWNKSLTEEGEKWKIGNWKQDRVESSTRGVAIRNNINYGVALMETRVDWSADAIRDGYILDNKAAMTGETSDRQIALNDTKFILRGVLIGGVHPRYDWQFLPRALTTEEKTALNLGPNEGVFDGVIYDDAISNTAVPTPDGKLNSNYTLVYDNLDYSKNDNTHENDIQNDVYVALEFVNNGDAFWGRDNLIPSGGVFYLGAKLTTKNETQSENSLTWPTDHEVPPIYEVADGVHDAQLGKSKKIPRVFIQDFLTKATFRIGSESLHYAYFTVPDLRSSQMSFGLSVELSWESGYVYDIEFGNNPGPAN